MQVLKLYENELFGDAYYDINFKKNINTRKPIHLPNDEDVKLLLKESNTYRNSKQETKEMEKLESINKISGVLLLGS